jgi:hypothetical protein
MENGKKENIEIIAKATGGVEAIPAGLYVATCSSVIDLGTQHNEKWDNDLHKVLITWEIPELLITTEKGDLPRVISQRYTLSLNERANLRKMLESWRGKPFTDEELRGFNITKLIGVGCQLQVVQSQANGKTYANVSAIVPLPKGTKASKLQNTAILFSLNNVNPETKLPEAMPDWVKGIIMQSKEWQATHVIDVPDSEVPEQLSDVDDSDIPF